MIRRIVGIETEFGITSVSAKGSRALGADEIARFLFRPIVEQFRSSNVFLGNGSRLYLDVGSHPEFATAECDGLRQLIAHDRAGEKIVDDLAVDAERTLAEQGIDAKVFLFKNNTDSAGHSYGCHENYLVDRSNVLRDVAVELLPFLVTRQLICGAGKILTEPDGSTTYCFSQRAEHMWDGVSSATTRSRPMINTRDEPHADSKRFRRMHIIVGDSNMIDATTMLKIASTRLVLELLESGVSMSHLAIANPVRAIREVSRDLGGGAEVALAGGGTATAMAIQREFLAEAEAHFARSEEAGDEREDREDYAAMLDLWRRALDAIESGDFSSIAAEIDWAAKLRLIRAYQEKGGLELGDPKLAQVDLAFHDIRQGRGIARLLEARGQLVRITSDEEIAAAAETPPQSTRAKLRGAFISAAQEAGAEFSVDWVHLKSGSGTSTVANTVALLDPFVTEDERVADLIAGFASVT
ncbi:Pup--protein ligase [Dietzia sp.]|uniref:Pup--protein ligase n=1 Tax=Dietzia sp. TaxID=1871616 RepID=UPI002FD8DE9B